MHPSSLAELTTLHLGGPAQEIHVAPSADDAIDLIAQSDAVGQPVLIVGGGSNLVVADDGFDGRVIQIASRGITRSDTTITVQAGHPWDDVVAYCTHEGLSGITALSGIPGLTGAGPIQNIGAYGVELSDVLETVEAWHRPSSRRVTLPADECHFGYRTSRFKQEPGDWLVLSVRLALHADRRAEPVRYDQLASALRTDLGAQPPMPAVRTAVLGLRASKGMLLDDADPDSVSAGSFFTNPIVSVAVHDRIGAVTGQAPPAWPMPDGQVKTSAAWLISQAGFAPGDGSPTGIAISSKHVLALVNRGRGTTSELLAFAGHISQRVHATFGVSLTPEPVIVGA